MTARSPSITVASASLNSQSQVSMEPTGRYRVVMVPAGIVTVSDPLHVSLVGLE